MELKRRKYTPEVNLYYQDDVSDELVEAIIRFVWLKQASDEEMNNFELVQNIRSQVYKMQFRNEIYYVKSYTPQNLSKIVKNFFRPADAVRYFRTAIRLSQAGVPIAQPVLALTRKTGFHPPDSIYVTREVPGINLWTYLCQGVRSDLEQRKKMVSQFAFMWSRLIKLRLVHQDPQLGNYIASFGATEKDIQVNMIDVDNIYFIPLLPRKIFWILNVRRMSKKLQVMNFPVTQAETDLFLTELDKFLK